MCTLKTSLTRSPDRMKSNISFTETKKEREGRVVLHFVISFVLSKKYRDTLLCKKLLIC